MLIIFNGRCRRLKRRPREALFVPLKPAASLQS